MCLAFDFLYDVARLKGTNIEEYVLVMEALGELMKSEGKIRLPPYNIRPTDTVAIIQNSAKPRGAFARFGLLPRWAKDTKAARNLNNARSETIFEKPAFKEAIRKQRCLIPATGFYEWPVYADSEQKLPYRVTMQDETIFMMAGVWETWTSAQTGQVVTAAIITTKANELIARYHDRMPLILAEEDWAVWLSPDEVNAAEIQDLFSPYPPELMKQYLVSALVNNSRNKTSDTLLPAIKVKGS